jgi:hypothetical protein
VGGAFFEQLDEIRLRHWGGQQESLADVATHITNRPQDYGILKPGANTNPN